MAIIPKNEYAAQITTGDVGWPEGKAKNVGVAGDGSGTPLEAKWVNDFFGLMQAFLGSADIAFSGFEEKVGASQFLDAFNKRIGTSLNLTARNWRIDYALDMLTPLSVTAQAPTPTSLQVSADGTKIFVLDQLGLTIFEYSLPTAWSLDKASYNGTSLLISGEMSNPWSMVFGSDGMTMFICDGATDLVHRYELSIAWNISSAIYDPITLSTAGKAIAPSALALRDDGRKLYAIGTGGVVYQYDLPTAWSFVGAGYDSLLLNVIPESGAYAKGITFGDNGNKFFMVETQNNTVHAYDMSTAWDISTGLPTGITFDVGPTVLDPQGINFSPSGGQLFILCGVLDSVYEFATGRLIT